MNRALRRAAGADILRGMKRPWEPLARKHLTPDEIAHAPRGSAFREAWLNNILSVQVYDRATAWGDVLHLALRRNDESELRGWDELQRAKNEVVGSHRVAVEVYPAEEEVINQANMRHLFVLPEGFELPLTIRGRWV